MSKRVRNGYKPTIVDRIRLGITNIRAKRKLKKTEKKFSTKIKKEDFVVKDTFETRDELKDYVKDIGKQLKEKDLGFEKLSTGVVVPKSKITQVRSRVKEINLGYEMKQSKIVRSTRKLFGDEIAEQVEKDLNELNASKRKRMMNADFEDLRKLDIDLIEKKISSEDDIDKLLTNLTENDYYQLDKREEAYRESYNKALIEVYGDNDDTNRLIELINKMDIDDFMTTYYNPYSNTQIKDIYDPEQLIGYIDYLTKTFERLYEITKGEKFVSEKYDLGIGYFE